MEWDSSFSLNNVIIDTQHKQLVSLINGFSNSTLKNTKTEALLWEFEEIIDFASVHFKAEEQIFKLSDYPETTEHIQEHKDLINILNTYKSRFTNDPSFLRDELVPFLEEWLRNHILVTDKGYQNFI